MRAPNHPHQNHPQWLLKRYIPEPYLGLNSLNSISTPGAGDWESAYLTGFLSGDLYAHRSLKSAGVDYPSC